MEKVFLRPGREKSLARRHPWIFSGGLADMAGRSPAMSTSPAISAGETVAVCAACGKVLGYGSFSPQSQIRVRMLSFDASIVPDEAYMRRLVAESAARRAGPGGAKRLVNAESDGLPGVVADFYSGWVVCQFTSAGAEFWKQAIADALFALPGCKGVCERADADAREREGLASGGFSVLRGEEPPELIEIDENGLRFLVDVRTGHKTGFYLDQRDARAAVRSFAAGRDVLNCFCYTGGFGIAAAAGGARSVTQVDVSAPALALAARNAELNGFGAGGSVAFEHVEADVFKYLRKCRDAGKTFDMIVLDPPKFAEARSQVMRAARGYKDINLLAMKLLRPGGILASFSCSGAIDDALFMKILAEAAADAGRDFQCIARTGHASDHPVSLSFPEGRYLKGEIVKLWNCEIMRFTL